MEITFEKKTINTITVFNGEEEVCKIVGKLDDMGILPEPVPTYQTKLNDKLYQGLDFSQLQKLITREIETMNIIH